MKTCQKCNSQFESKIVIDGKERVLSSRKYCLDCSPFGKHNTGKLHLDKNEIYCNVCNKQYIYSKKKGHTLTTCNTCRSNKIRNDNRKKATDYKGGKCNICGYSKCIDALCFHHVNPKEKSFGLSNNYNKEWTVLKEELDKCILLCLNCHAELHAGAVSITANAPDS